MILISMLKKMVDKNMDYTQFLHDFGEALWKTYLVDRDYDKLIQSFSDDITWFGTGKHERYLTLSETMDAFSKERDIYDGQFLIDSIWSRSVKLSDEIYLLFGEVMTKTEESRDELLKFCMRFTGIFRYTKEGWKIVHCHISVPDEDQENGAFFPESISKSTYHILMRAIQKNQEELDILTNSIPGGVVKFTVENNKFRVLYTNDGLYELVGYSREEFEENYRRNKDRLFFLSEKERTKLNRTLRAQALEGKPLQAEIKTTAKDGEIRWLSLEGRKSISEGMSVYQCILTDITSLKKVQYELEIEKERYLAVSQLSQDIIFEYDIATKTLYNFFKKEAMEKFPSVIQNYRETCLKENYVHPDDVGEFLKLCNAMDRGIDNLVAELRLRQEDKYLWYEIQGKTVCNEEGKPIKIIGRKTDIDLKKRELDLLKRKADFDALTGLFNRGTTESMIKKTLMDSSPLEKHAFIITDLDDFKIINDKNGHQFGDSVLKEVANHIRSVVRTTDIVGRVGGDEFIIFLKNFQDKNVILQKLRDIFESMRGMDISKHWEITGSFGVAVYPDDGTSYEVLFSKADIALYLSKDSGKNKFSFFTENGHPEDLASIERKDIAPLLHREEEDLASYAFDLMLESQDVKSAILSLLQKIGTQFRLSRACILEIDKVRDSVKVTYEWCRPDIPSRRLCREEVPFSIWNDSMVQNSKNNITIFVDTEKEAGTTEGLALFRQLKVKSQIQCIIYDSDEVKGSLCFEHCDQVHAWTVQEVTTISNFSKIVGAYFLNMRAKEEMEEERLLTTAIAQNQNLLTYLLKSNTYEILYLSPNIKRKFPRARVGDVCYEVLQNRKEPCLNCPLRKETKGSIEDYNESLDWWVNTTATKINIGNNEIADLICISNITDYRKRIASVDPLTGISSLSQFTENVEYTLDTAGNGPYRYAIFYSDFDKFKYINEVNGYKTGNQVLISFASMMSAHLNLGEYICRSSSDMFITFFRYTDPNEFKTRMTHLEQEIEKWRSRNFPSLKITIIGGLYLIRPGERDFSGILDRANIARKSVKGSHTTQFALYDDILHAKVTKEKEVELQMVDALTNHEFQVYLQPKVDLQKGIYVGAEALVRWKRQDGQIMMPKDFIPLFEKNGFIIYLDSYISEQVFQIIRRWMDSGKQVLPISINVSRVFVKDNRFIPHMKYLLDKYRIPPGLIELELTESIYIDSTDYLVCIINELRDLGFIFSIDDFGSGYSSLNLLRQLPIDVLKLDKDFFDHENMTAKERMVLSNIVLMAKGLQMKVLSEGIETKSQADFLRDIGCDMAQGFYWAEPMPVSEFEQFLKNRKNISLWTGGKK